MDRNKDIVMKMQIDEAKELLKNNGYELKEKTTEVPTNKVYIVVMDGGENDDYAVLGIY